jgi:Recombinase zinc beta ribbon domain
VNVGTEANERQPLPSNQSTDPYLLRSLLRCGLCGSDQVTVLQSNGRRAYGCRNVGCKQRTLSAEEIEQLVWCRFVSLNETFAAAVNRHQRQAVLREVLKRVTVFSGPSDFEIEWRD